MATQSVDVNSDYLAALRQKAVASAKIKKIEKDAEKALKEESARLEAVDAVLADIDRRLVQAVQSPDNIVCWLLEYITCDSLREQASEKNHYWKDGHWDDFQSLSADTASQWTDSEAYRKLFAEIHRRGLEVGFRSLSHTDDGIGYTFSSGLFVVLPSG